MVSAERTSRLLTRPNTTRKCMCKVWEIFPKGPLQGSTTFLLLVDFPQKSASRLQLVGEATAEKKKQQHQDLNLQSETKAWRSQCNARLTCFAEFSPNLFLSPSVVVVSKFRSLRHRVAFRPRLVRVPRGRTSAKGSLGQKQNTDACDLKP